MDRDFKRALTKLNEEQRRAVERINGPLLVIAGPGTGKTQLLSMRVANILGSTDTTAGSILCLTFTNKAAVNMKERIVELAGPAGARVNVRTFHSFAGELMNSYPDIFWNSAKLAVAPQTVQLDIIESIVSKLPLDNPLAQRFAGQYTLLSDVAQAINLVKDAGLTPEKLRAVIEGNLAYIDLIEKRLVTMTEPKLTLARLPNIKRALAKLPKQGIDNYVRPVLALDTVMLESLEASISSDEVSRKCSQTSKWKRRWIQTENGQKGMFIERRRNDWWLNLAEVYGAYRAQIHERGFYDYADMLVEVIAQLEQNPAMLADVQERFSYVMIDEFQDTNPAQLRLAHLVADHFETGSSPNLMAVGDDDQSIFKFNGAELNNMLDFRRSYPKAKTIVLQSNYRSTQTLLDGASRIISQADSRLINFDTKLKKELVAAAHVPEGLVEARSYRSRELQMSLMGREIKKSFKPNRSLAVLARSHDSLLRMTGILQQLGVPVRYEQQSNILDHEAVTQTGLIVELLAAINAGDAATADAAMHQIIRSPIWGVPPKDLWQLALSTKTNWLDAMVSSRGQLKTLGNWFLTLSSDATSQPLAITIEQVIGLRASVNFLSPMRDYFTKNQTKDMNYYLHGLSAIQLLRALVHEFSKTEQAGLKDLARFISLNRTNGQIIADESPFITASHAVTLLTVHKAKGLEFDDVYIIDAIDDNWRARAGGRRPPANLPLRPPQDDFDDYVRLMYVAATRAKSSLVIGAYSSDHAGKEVAISPIVQAAFDIKQIEETNTRQLVQVLEENLHWPDLSGGQESEMLKARLETYSLSVTHLLNFLDLTRGGPNYFKERNLLRLPELKTNALALGTAVHAALERGQLLANAGKFNLSNVQKEFTRTLEIEQIAPQDFERFKSEGLQMLKRLFNELGYRLPKGSQPEQRLSLIKIGGALVGGKLDRVDEAGNSLRIIDYKTGRPVTNFSSRDQSQALKIYKHKSQMIFYALLAGEHPRFSRFTNVECQMVYVESQKATDLVKTYRPSSQDIARMARLVEAVWTKIKALQFPDTSRYSTDLDGILAFEQDLLNEKNSDSSIN